MNKTHPEYRFMQNRELSWLRFNERVLEEAKDPNVPLMERLKFISIFTSNLDEFFMIRVGSLYDLSTIDNTAIDNKTGLTPNEQLGQVYEAVIPLYAEKDKLYRSVTKELSDFGIYAMHMKDLNEFDMKVVKQHFKKNVLPLLSPQIVDPHHPFPHFPSKQVHIIAYLDGAKSKHLGIIPVPDSIPSVLFLPSDKIRYLHMEEIILWFSEQIFSMYRVLEKTYLCVTRNADLTADDDLFDETVDFRLAMKKLLTKRNRLAVVRMETASSLSAPLQEILFDKLSLNASQVYETTSPMNLSYVFSMGQKFPAAMHHQMFYPDFTPLLPKTASLSESILKQVKRHDYLFSHPFESMDFFLAMIKEAGRDSSVVSIKITIYRLAQKAKLVEYLSTAAENGKEVTVIIELRARFDEQNNIDWSERLEEAGCRVIYGFDEYKVHSKICLITYRHKGAVKYITQIGTGNYNESTVKQYTDLSLITADDAIGEDAASFFKNMAVGNLDATYSHLLVAPTSFKSGILRLIETETEKGKDGRILMKLNSITDKDVILTLAKASKAGVKIDLIVRGICCILPQVKEETENITVRSIVGRFLEHSRVYRFGEGEHQLMFISSADLMTRNTERRVEVACPIMDEAAKEKINWILNACMKDNLKARTMKDNGTYVTVESSGVPFSSQDYFIKEARNDLIDQNIADLTKKVSMIDRIKHRLIRWLSD